METNNFIKFQKLKESFNERMSLYSDSRQPTDDEVSIAWLILMLDEKIKNTVSNKKYLNLTDPADL
jgi:hypothetical protein